jgi:hypothetical protein
MPVVISTLAVVSNPGFAQSLKEEYREKTIGLSEVPQAVIAAARKALGTAPTEAKLIQGTKLANGKVIKLEHEEKGES